MLWWLFAVISLVFLFPQLLLGCISVILLLLDLCSAWLVITIDWNNNAITLSNIVLSPAVLHSISKILNQFIPLNIARLSVRSVRLSLPVLFPSHCRSYSCGQQQQQQHSTSTSASVSLHGVSNSLIHLAVDGFTVDLQTTNCHDWDLIVAVQQAIANKMFLADYYSTIIESFHEESRKDGAGSGSLGVSLLHRVLDHCINLFCLSSDNSHMRVFCNPAQSVGGGSSNSNSNSNSSSSSGGGSSSSSSSNSSVDDNNGSTGITTSTTAPRRPKQLPQHQKQLRDNFMWGIRVAHCHLHALQPTSAACCDPNSSDVGHLSSQRKGIGIRGGSSCGGGYRFGMIASVIAYMRRLYIFCTGGGGGKGSSSSSESSPTNTVAAAAASVNVKGAVVRDFVLYMNPIVTDTVPDTVADADADTDACTAAVEEGVIVFVRNIDVVLLIPHVFACLLRPGGMVFDPGDVPVVGAAEAAPGGTTGGGASTSAHAIAPGAGVGVGKRITLSKCELEGVLLVLQEDRFQIFLYVGLFGALGIDKPQCIQEHVRAEPDDVKTPNVVGAEVGSGGGNRTPTPLLSPGSVHWKGGYGMWKGAVERRVNDHYCTPPSKATVAAYAALHEDLSKLQQQLSVGEQNALQWLFKETVTNISVYLWNHRRLKAELNRVQQHIREIEQHLPLVCIMKLRRRYRSWNIHRRMATLLSLDLLEGDDRNGVGDCSCDGGGDGLANRLTARSQNNNSRQPRPEPTDSAFMWLVSAVLGTLAGGGQSTWLVYFREALKRKGSSTCFGSGDNSSSGRYRIIKPGILRTFFTARQLRNCGLTELPPFNLAFSLPEVAVPSDATSTPTAASVRGPDNGPFNNNNEHDEDDDISDPLADSEANYLMQEYLQVAGAIYADQFAPLRVLDLVGVRHKDFKILVYNQQQQSKLKSERKPQKGRGKSFCNNNYNNKDDGGDGGDDGSKNAERQQTRTTSLPGAGPYTLQYSINAESVTFSAVVVLGRQDLYCYYVDYSLCLSNYQRNLRTSPFGCGEHFLQPVPMSAVGLVEQECCYVDSFHDRVINTHGDILRTPMHESSASMCGSMSGQEGAINPPGQNEDDGFEHPSVVSEMSYTNTEGRFENNTWITTDATDSAVDTADTDTHAGSSPTAVPATPASHSSSRSHGHSRYCPSSPLSTLDTPLQLGRNISHVSSGSCSGSSGGAGGGHCSSAGGGGYSSSSALKQDYHSVVLGVVLFGVTIIDERRSATSATRYTNSQCDAAVDNTPRGPSSVFVTPNNSSRQRRRQTKTEMNGDGEAETDQEDEEEGESSSSSGSDGRDVSYPPLRRCMFEGKKQYLDSDATPVHNTPSSNSIPGSACTTATATIAGTSTYNIRVGVSVLLGGGIVVEVDLANGYLCADQIPSILDTWAIIKRTLFYQEPPAHLTLALTQMQWEQAVVPPDKVLRDHLTALWITHTGFDPVQLQTPRPPPSSPCSPAAAASASASSHLTAVFAPYLILGGSLKLSLEIILDNFDLILLPAVPVEVGSGRSSKHKQEQEHGTKAGTGNAAGLPSAPPVRGTTAKQKSSQKTPQNSAGCRGRKPAAGNTMHDSPYFRSESIIDDALNVLEVTTVDVQVITVECGLLFKSGPTSEVITMNLQSLKLFSSQCVVIDHFKRWGSDNNSYDNNRHNLCSSTSTGANILEEAAVVPSFLQNMYCPSELYFWSNTLTVIADTRGLPFTMVDPKNKYTTSSPNNNGAAVNGTPAPYPACSGSSETQGLYRNQTTYIHVAQVKSDLVNSCWATVEDPLAAVDFILNPSDRAGARDFDGFKDREDSHGRTGGGHSTNRRDNNRDSTVIIGVHTDPWGGVVTAAFQPDAAVVNQREHSSGRNIAGVVDWGSGVVAGTPSTAATGVGKFLDTILSVDDVKGLGDGSDSRGLSFAPVAGTSVGVGSSGGSARRSRRWSTVRGSCVCPINLYNLDACYVVALKSTEHVGNAARIQHKYQSYASKLIELRQVLYTVWPNSNAAPTLSGDLHAPAPVDILFRVCVRATVPLYKLPPVVHEGDDDLLGGGVGSSCSAHRSRSSERFSVRSSSLVNSLSLTGGPTHHAVTAAEELEDLAPPERPAGFTPVRLPTLRVSVDDLKPVEHCFQTAFDACLTYDATHVTIVAEFVLCRPDPVRVEQMSLESQESQRQHIPISVVVLETDTEETGADVSAGCSSVCDDRTSSNINGSSVASIAYNLPFNSADWAPGGGGYRPTLRQAVETLCPLRPCGMSARDMRVLGDDIPSYGAVSLAVEVTSPSVCLYINSLQLLIQSGAMEAEYEESGPGVAAATGDGDGDGGASKTSRQVHCRVTTRLPSSAADEPYVACSKSFYIESAELIVFNSTILYSHANSSTLTPVDMDSSDALYFLLPTVPNTQLQIKVEIFEEAHSSSFSSASVFSKDSRTSGAIMDTNVDTMTVADRLIGVGYIDFDSRRPLPRSHHGHGHGHDGGDMSVDIYSVDPTPVDIGALTYKLAWNNAVSDTVVAARVGTGTGTGSTPGIASGVGAGSDVGVMSNCTSRSLFEPPELSDAAAPGTDATSLPSGSGFSSTSGLGASGNAGGSMGSLLSIYTAGPVRSAGAHSPPRGLSRSSSASRMGIVGPSSIMHAGPLGILEASAPRQAALVVDIDKKLSLHLSSASITYDASTLQTTLDCLGVLGASFATPKSPSEGSLAAKPGETATDVEADTEVVDRTESCTDFADEQSRSKPLPVPSTSASSLADGPCHIHALTLAQSESLYARYGDFNSSVCSGPILEPYASLSLLLSKANGAVIEQRLRMFWSLLMPPQDHEYHLRHRDFQPSLVQFQTLTQAQLPSQYSRNPAEQSFDRLYDVPNRGDAVLREGNNLQVLQSRMVVNLHSFYFAASCWHFIVAPKLYNIVLPRNIEAKSKLPYRLMKSPVALNDKVFIDSQMVIVDMSPELASMHLCGIRTALVDRVYAGEKVLQFNLCSGRKYAVYVAVDSRYVAHPNRRHNRLPSWMNTCQLERTKLYIKTSSSASFVVFVMKVDEEDFIRRFPKTGTTTAATTAAGNTTGHGSGRERRFFGSSFSASANHGRRRTIITTTTTAKGSTKAPLSIPITVTLGGLGMDRWTSNHNYFVLVGSLSQYEQSVGSNSAADATSDAAAAAASSSTRSMVAMSRTSSSSTLMNSSMRHIVSMVPPPLQWKLKVGMVLRHFDAHRVPGAHAHFNSAYPHSHIYSPSYSRMHSPSQSPGPSMPSTPFRSRRNSFTEPQLGATNGASTAVPGDDCMIGYSVGSTNIGFSTITEHNHLSVTAEIDSVTLDYVQTGDCSLLAPATSFSSSVYQDLHAEPNDGIGLSTSIGTGESIFNSAQQDDMTLTGGGSGVLLAGERRVIFSLVLGCVHIDTALSWFQTTKSDVFVPIMAGREISLPVLMMLQREAGVVVKADGVLTGSFHDTTLQRENGCDWPEGQGQGEGQYQPGQTQEPTGTNGRTYLVPFIEPVQLQLAVTKHRQQKLVTASFIQAKDCLVADVSQSLLRVVLSVSRELDALKRCQLNNYTTTRIIHTLAADAHAAGLTTATPIASPFNFSVATGLNTCIGIGRGSPSPMGRRMRMLSSSPLSTPRSLIGSSLAATGTEHGYDTPGNKDNGRDRREQEHETREQEQEQESSAMEVLSTVVFDNQFGCDIALTLHNIPSCRAVSLGQKEVHCSPEEETKKIFKAVEGYHSFLQTQTQQQGNRHLQQESLHDNSKWGGGQSGEDGRNGVVGNGRDSRIMLRVNARVAVIFRTLAVQDLLSAAIAQAQTQTQAQAQAQSHAQTGDPHQLPTTTWVSELQLSKLCRKIYNSIRVTVSLLHGEWASVEKIRLARGAKLFYPLTHTDRFIRAQARAHAYSQQCAHVDEEEEEEQDDDREFGGGAGVDGLGAFALLVASTYFTMDPALVQQLAGVCNKYTMCVALASNISLSNHTNSKLLLYADTMTQQQQQQTEYTPARAPVQTPGKPLRTPGNRRPGHAMLAPDTSRTIERTPPHLHPGIAGRTARHSVVTVPVKETRFLPFIMLSDERLNYEVQLPSIHSTAAASSSAPIAARGPQNETNKGTTGSSERARKHNEYIGCSIDLKHHLFDIDVQSSLRRTAQLDVRSIVLRLEEVVACVEPVDEDIRGFSSDAADTPEDGAAAPNDTTSGLGGYLSDKFRCSVWNNYHCVTLDPEVVDEMNAGGGDDDSSIASTSTVSHRSGRSDNTTWSDVDAGGHHEEEGHVIGRWTLLFLPAITFRNVLPMNLVIDIIQAPTVDIPVPDPETEEDCWGSNDVGDDSRSSGVGTGSSSSTGAGSGGPHAAGGGGGGAPLELFYLPDDVTVKQVDKNKEHRLENSYQQGRRFDAKLPFVSSEWMPFTLEPEGTNEKDGDVVGVGGPSTISRPASKKRLRHKFSSSLYCRMVVLPGQEQNLPILQTDRSVYYRIHIPDSGVWSKPFAISPDSYDSRSMFDKSPAELVDWDVCEHTAYKSVSGPGASMHQQQASVRKDSVSAISQLPQIHHTKSWYSSDDAVGDFKIGKLVEFYSGFWVINKSGLNLQYTASGSEYFTEGNQAIKHTSKVLKTVSGALNMLGSVSRSALNTLAGDHEDASNRYYTPFALSDEAEDLRASYDHRGPGSSTAGAIGTHVLARLYANAEITDVQYRQALGSDNVPLLLCCPTKKLQLLPVGINHNLSSSCSSHPDGHPVGYLGSSKFGDRSGGDAVQQDTQIFIYDMRVNEKSKFSGLTHRYYAVQTGLADGCSIYADDPSQCITEFPLELMTKQGKDKSLLIQTLNADRFYSSNNATFLSFRCSHDCFVYVCIDVSRQSVAGWMQRLGFKTIGGRIRCTYCSYQVFKKYYCAHSWIQLGGNGSSHTLSMPMSTTQTTSTTATTVSATGVRSSGSATGSSASTSIGGDGSVRMYSVIVSRADRTDREACVSNLRVGEVAVEERGFIGQRVNDYRLVSHLTAGDSIYTDSGASSIYGGRYCTIDQLPDRINNVPGLVGIQTSSSDTAFERNRTSRGYITFTTVQDCYVIVCVDKKLPCIPTWLPDTEFKQTTMRMFANNDKTEFVLWCRYYDKSSNVAIGGIGIIDKWQYDQYENVFVIVADAMNVHDSAEGSLPSSRTPSNNGFRNINRMDSSSSSGGCSLESSNSSSFVSGSYPGYGPVPFPAPGVATGPSSPAEAAVRGATPLRDYGRPSTSNNGVCSSDTAAITASAGVAVTVDDVGVDMVTLFDLDSSGNPLKQQSAAVLSGIAAAAGCGKLNEFWDELGGHLSQEGGPQHCCRTLIPDFYKYGRQYSRPFGLDIGNSGELNMSSATVAVNIQQLPGLFHRTSVVTLTPRFIVLNQLEFPVEIIPFSGTGDLDLQLLQKEVPDTSRRSAVVLPSDSCAVYNFPPAGYRSTMTTEVDINRNKNRYKYSNGSSSGNVKQKLASAASTLCGGSDEHPSSRIHRRCISLRWFVPKPQNQTWQFNSQSCHSTGHPSGDSDDDFTTSLYENLSQKVSVDKIGEQYVWLHRNSSSNDNSRGGGSVDDVNSAGIGGGCRFGYGNVSCLDAYDDTGTNTAISSVTHVDSVIACVTTMLEGDTIFIRINNASSTPPYRLENWSPFVTLLVKQQRFMYYSKLSQLQRSRGGHAGPQLYAPTLVHADPQSHGSGASVSADVNLTSVGAGDSFSVPTRDKGNVEAENQHAFDRSGCDHDQAHGHGHGHHVEEFEEVQDHQQQRGEGWVELPPLSSKSFIWSDSFVDAPKLLVCAKIPVSLDDGSTEFELTPPQAYSIDKIGKLPLYSWAVNTPRKPVWASTTTTTATTTDTSADLGIAADREKYAGNTGGARGRLREVPMTVGLENRNHDRCRNSIRYSTSRPASSARVDYSNYLRIESSDEDDDEDEDEDEDDDDGAMSENKLEALASDLRLSMASSSDSSGDEADWHSHDSRCTSSSSSSEGEEDEERNGSPEAIPTAPEPAHEHLPAHLPVQLRSQQQNHQHCRHHHHHRHYRHDEPHFSGSVGVHVVARRSSRVIIFQEIPHDARKLYQELNVNSYRDASGATDRYYSGRNALRAPALYPATAAPMQIQLQVPPLQQVLLRLMNAKLYLRGLALYAQDSDSDRDLLSLSIERVRVNYCGHSGGFELSVFHVQIDDLREEAKFPIVLAPSNSGFNSVQPDNPWTTTSSSSTTTTTKVTESIRGRNRTTQQRARGSGAASLSTRTLKARAKVQAKKVQQQTKTSAVWDLTSLGRRVSRGGDGGANSDIVGDDDNGQSSWFPTDTGIAEGARQTILKAVHTASTATSTTRMCDESENGEDNANESAAFERKNIFFHYFCSLDKMTGYADSNSAGERKQGSNDNSNSNRNNTNDINIGATSSPIFTLSQLRLVNILLGEITMKIDAEMLVSVLDWMSSLMSELHAGVNSNPAGSYNNGYGGDAEAIIASSSTLLLQQASLQAAQTLVFFHLQRDKTDAHLESDKLIYMESFFLSDIVINSELFVGPDLLDRMDSQRMDMSIAVGFAILGGPLLSHLTQVLLSIAHISPVFVFNSSHYEHYFGSSLVLYKKLINKLTKQALLQVSYKVFGSLELLGNPLSLLEDLNSGVTDFVSITAQEVTGRKQFRAAGVQSLLKSVVHGSAGVFSRQLGSLAEVVKSVANTANVSVSATAMAAELDVPPARITDKQRTRSLFNIWQQSLNTGYYAIAVQPANALHRRGVLSAVYNLGKGGLQVGALTVSSTLETMSVGLESVQDLTSNKKKKKPDKEMKHRILGRRNELATAAGAAGALDTLVYQTSKVDNI